MGASVFATAWPMTIFWSELISTLFPLALSSCGPEDRNARNPGRFFRSQFSSSSSLPDLYAFFSASKNTRMIWPPSQRRKDASATHNNLISLLFAKRDAVQLFDCPRPLKIPSREMILHLKVLHSSLFSSFSFLFQSIQVLKLIAPGKSSRLLLTLNLILSQAQITNRTGMPF